MITVSPVITCLKIGHTTMCSMKPVHTINLEPFVFILALFFLNDQISIRLLILVLIFQTSVIKTKYLFLVLDLYWSWNSRTFKNWKIQVVCNYKYLVQNVIKSYIYKATCVSICGSHFCSFKISGCLEFQYELDQLQK